MRIFLRSRDNSRRYLLSRDDVRVVRLYRVRDVSPDISSRCKSLLIRETYMCTEKNVLCYLARTTTLRGQIATRVFPMNEDSRFARAKLEEYSFTRKLRATYYLIVVLVSQRGQMSGTVVSYVPYVPHLTLVALANPFHLLDAIVLDSVHLLRVILPQSLELLALILLDVVEHLVDLLRPRRYSYASTAQAPLDASAPARNS